MTFDKKFEIGPKSMEGYLNVKTHYIFLLDSSGNLYLYSFYALGSMRGKNW